MTIDSDVRVVHIRKINGFTDISTYGGMTVAYSWRKGDTFIVCSTAICSDRDVFSRKKGNALAMEGYVLGQVIRLPYSRAIQKSGITPTTHVRAVFQSSI
jgi:hypothetical protein